MLDPNKTTMISAQQKRRALFAVMIMATSPLFADGPQSSHAIPPLPLKTESVQSNPFCRPALPALQLKGDSQQIQLASGSRASTIRLRPIGAAIGLQSIANPNAPSGAPRAIRPTAMTIESVPSPVQANPLIQSAHHDNGSLVDAPLVDRTHADIANDQRADVNVRQFKSRAASADHKSTLKLIPAIPVTPPVSPPTVQQAVVADLPTIPVPPAEHHFKPEPKKKSEPVYFSMSDRFDTPASSTEIKQPVPVAEAVEESPVVAELVPIEPAVVMEVPELVDAESVVAEPIVALNKVIRRDDELISQNDSSDEQTTRSSTAKAVSVTESVEEPSMLEEVDSDLKPIQSVLDRSDQQSIAVYQHAVTGPVESPEATLHTKRYRPPVAVKPVPIVFERQADEPSTTLAGSLLRTAESIDFDGLKAAHGKLKLTPLYMSRAQVRSLTLGGSIRQVKVANKSVCQAFAAGPNQLKLIGTGNGVTRLIVWADTDDVKNPTRMRAFEVHVKDAVETTGNSLGNKVAMLNQTIQKTFPASDVHVRRRGNQLVVAGRCGSETSAKKIMQMVRKTCLVPTQDELVIR